MRNLLIGALLIPCAAQAMPGLSHQYGSHGMTYTSAAAFNALAWDTSHAGSAMPDTSAWSTKLHEDWSSGASCPSVTGELFKPQPIDTTHKFFGYAIDADGSCASGKFVFTEEYGGVHPAAWSTFSLGTLSLNYSGLKVKTGDFRVNYKLSTVDASLHIHFTIWNQARYDASPREQPYPERDACETGQHNGADSATTEHLWPGTRPAAGQIISHIFVQTFPNICPRDNAWHVLDIIESRDFTKVYSDGLEVARIAKPANDDMQQAVGFLVDLETPTQATDTTKTAMINLGNIDVLAPPNGSCYNTGGC